MSVLSSLEPGEVFHFFEEICNIPHGSGNVEQISNYLRDFAKERNLFCIQDEMKNIIIVKEATPGYEKEEPIIIQGHMDMVAVHKPELDIDMKKEPLKLKVDGDFIYAEGTSLGGDDGIAVAYALAFLDSATLAHPKLEVLFTVDEEIGMDGAMAVDLSMLTGHQLLNIDSEEEGILLTSCAGGSRADCELSVTRETVTGKAYSVKVCGLQGGHSGVEIHKERGNANCLMGRILYDILKVTSVNLVSMQGGMADNAITNETTAVLIPADAAAFESSVKETEQQIKAELATKDPDFRVEISEFSEENCQAVAVADVKRIGFFDLHAS